MSTKRTRTWAFSTAILLGMASAQAADWPHWRGPNFDGSSPETGLPTSWSKTENVFWAADMPGIGSGTPVVVGDRVYVSSLSKGGGGNLLGLCLDAATGKVLWKADLGPARREKRGNPSAASPVADEQRAYFLFSTGLLAAVDRNGTVVWRRDLAKDYGPFKILFSYAVSPLLHEGRLYVSVLHRMGKTGSFVLAINPEDGKTIWKVTRVTKASGESQEAYTSHVPFEANGVKGVLVAGGEAVTLHHPATGKEIWRYEHAAIRNGRLVTTPTPMDGLVACGLPQNNPAYVLKAGGSSATKAWTATGDAKPDVPSSAHQGGKLYVLDGDKKVLTCWDAKTGKKLGESKLGGTTYWASPTVADGKVYCIDRKGRVVVSKADASLEKLAEFSMGENGCESTIAVAGGRLYVRTPGKLYCIGLK